MSSRNLVRIQPIEMLSLSPEIDGSLGTNRAFGKKALISANTDIDAIKAWLMRFIDTPSTFQAYRKESERLLLWSTEVLGLPISSLTHEDMLHYQHFTHNPQPAWRWVMKNNYKASRNHPDWRPFAGPLSLSSLRQAMVILNTMFTWLVNARYLKSNPLSLARQKNHAAPPRIVRFLDEDLWEKIKETISTLPQSSDREREHYYRSRWVFTLFYLCGMRISEVVNNTTQGFFYRRDHEGTIRWWLEITGKGNKVRLIPATNELMQELAYYRKSRGLTSEPMPGEKLPLVFPLGTRQTAMTRANMHIIVKKIFNDTANRLRDQGEAEAKLAQRIEKASAHWLRHTASSHMLNGKVDLLNVRDNMGHASIATTNLYLHSTDDTRHKNTQDSHKIKW